MSKIPGMLAAWSRGDVKAIARTFDHDLAASPELKQALIKRRNENWTKWIEQRIAPGSVLIAVGAGHLAGKDLVIELLKKDGTASAGSNRPHGRFRCIRRENFTFLRISLDIF